MDALIALLPILVVLGLMLFARWPAVRAGAAALLLAVVVVIAVFPFETIDTGIAGGLIGSLAEAVFTSATILWIILPALAIYNLQNETDAVESIRSGLTELSRDPRVTALVVAWFFSLLLEGAAGFGTSAALAAPFLVALGMTPVRAVTAAMIGHLVGVTFGAVGTPVVPMVAASGLEPVDISSSIGVQAALVGWSVPIVVVYMIGRSYPDERPQRSRTSWLLGFATAVLFFVPYLAMALLVGPELPTLAGAIVGGAIFAFALRSRTAATDTSESADASEPAGEMSLGRAMAPYLFLVGLVLVTRLVPSLNDALEEVTVSWEAVDGTFGGSFAPLFHPGTLLFVALAAGALVQGASAIQVRSAITDSARTLVPVAAALVAMLGLARIMVHSGMVDEIAEAAADSVGGAWPLLAPAVGALGTFVTGSATASNALFSDLQIGTATQVGDPVDVTLGAQGFGAALGNAIAPHNLIAAAAIVGLGGRESDILRRTLPVALPLIAAAGVLALVLAN